jgi:hypothetical protein
MRRSVLAVAVLALLSSGAVGHADGCPPLKVGAPWKCPGVIKPDAPKRLGISVRVQPRYSFTEEAPGQPDWGVRDDTSANDGYNTRRLRISYVRQFSENWLGFVHVRRDWGMDDFKLYDGYVTATGWDRAHITVGQMTAPFDRPYLTSDVQLPLAERPLVSGLFAPQHQIGVLLHHQEMDSRLGWAVGGFTGNGLNDCSSAGGIMPVARVEWVATPHLSLGVNWAYKDGVQTSNFQKFLSKNGSAYGLQPFYAARQVSESAWGVDLLYRQDGLNVHSGYTALAADGPAMGVDADGWYVHCGKFVPFAGRKDRLELVAGYEQIDPNRALTDQLDARWATFGFNYHVKGCEQMWRAQYVCRDEATGEVANNTFLVEYAFAFSQ